MLDFWEDPGLLLVDTLNHAFEYGELSTSQRQAVITLIGEKGQRQETYKELEANLSFKCWYKNCFHGSSNEDQGISPTVS